jgi:hypothetical protein
MRMAVLYIRFGETGLLVGFKARSLKALCCMERPYAGCLVRHPVSKVSWQTTKREIAFGSGLEKNIWKGEING